MDESICKYLDKDVLKFDVSGSNGNWFLSKLFYELISNYENNLNLSRENSKLTNEPYIKILRATAPAGMVKVGMFRVTVCYLQSKNTIEISSEIFDNEANAYNFDSNFMKTKHSIDASILNNKSVSLNDVLLLIFKVNTELMSIMYSVDMISRPYVLKGGPLIRVTGNPQKSYQTMSINELKTLVLSDVNKYLDAKVFSKSILTSLYTILQSMCDDGYFESNSNGIKCLDDGFETELGSYKLLVCLKNNQACCDIKFIGSSKNRDVDNVISQTIIVDNFDITHNVKMDVFLDYVTRLSKIIKFVDSLNYDIL